MHNNPSENNVSVKFITPAVVRGELVARGTPKKVDFVVYRQHIPLVHYGGGGLPVAVSERLSGGGPLGRPARRLRSGGLAAAFSPALSAADRRLAQVEGWILGVG